MTLTGDLEHLGVQHAAALIEHGGGQCPLVRIGAEDVPATASGLVGRADLRLRPARDGLCGHSFPPGGRVWWQCPGDKSPLSVQRSYQVKPGAEERVGGDISTQGLPKRGLDMPRVSPRLVLEPTKLSSP